ncbi:hypothetical protein C8R46DRAFT_1302670 [Mycena filopes]|nr:hypothetical protein C8R46DRAFT_1302670 [Mycena filopes]
MPLPWVLVLTLGSVLAVPTNHTIDDTNPLVRYSDIHPPIRCPQAGQCETLLGSNLRQLFNGSASILQGLDKTLASVSPAVEFNFTGTALYVFFMLLPPISVPQLRTTYQATLDGVSESMIAPLVHEVQYNVSAYSKSALPPGQHVFQIRPTNTTILLFDYLVYTDDPDPSAPSDPSAPPARVKPWIPGVVGGVTLTLIVVAGLIFYRRRMQRALHKPILEEGGLASSSEGMNSTRKPQEFEIPRPTAPAPQQHPNPAVADRIRLLQQEVEWLQQRGRSGSGGSDTASVVRLLLAMKAAEETSTTSGSPHEAGAERTVVHDDSGLRWPARVVELPPAYAAD